MSSEEAESDAAVNVTWRELHDHFGPGTAAEGRVLSGVVSFRDEANWHTSPNIRLCDKDGEDAAVFFYTSLAPQYNLDELHLGYKVTLRAPRLHWFADRQCGVRVDSVAQIARMEPGCLTSALRLRFAGLMRRRGNEWTSLGEWERAVTNYRSAADLLAYTLTVDSLQYRHSYVEEEEEGAESDGREVAAQQLRLRSGVLSNLCLCHVQLREWHKAIAIGQEALRLLPRNTITSNDDDEETRYYTTLRAKLCYRVALVSEQLRDYQTAFSYATEANALLETRPDAAVRALYVRLQRARAEEGSGWRAVLRERQARTRLPDMSRDFDRRRNFFASDRSDVGVNGLRLRAHIVDVSGLLSIPAPSRGSTIQDDNDDVHVFTVPPHPWYVVADLLSLKPYEMNVLRDTLGLKTFLYLRLGFRPLPTWSAMLLAMKCVVVRPSITHQGALLHVDLSQIPRLTSVAVEVDLLRVMLPAWLYWVLSACAYIGLHALCEYVLHWWCYTSDTKTPRAAFLTRLKPTLAALLQGPLADPAHYAIMFLSNDHLTEACVLTLLLQALDTTRHNPVLLSGAVGAALRMSQAPLVKDEMQPDDVLWKAGRQARRMMREQENTRDVH